jgi:hypothetical protein
MPSPGPGARGGGHSFSARREAQLVVQDDQSSPAGALAATQVLVNQDHVFALIDASALFAAAYKYTVQNNVPVLGWGDSTEFSDPGNRNLFAYFGSPTSNLTAVQSGRCARQLPGSDCLLESRSPSALDVSFSWAQHPVVAGGTDWPHHETH